MSDEGAQKAPVLFLGVTVCYALLLGVVSLMPVDAHSALGATLGRRTLNNLLAMLSHRRKDRVNKLLKSSNL